MAGSLNTYHGCTMQMYHAKDLKTAKNYNTKTYKSNACDVIILLKDSFETNLKGTRILSYPGN